MTLYACTSCGTVRVDEDRCYVCGDEDFEAVEDDDGHVCEECGKTFPSEKKLNGHKSVHSR